MSVDRAPWWRGAVVYQIYPRSFLDASGDGVGDLEGIRRGLEHLAWLGVDALWLSPVYRSPMADFGYDVADHCAIDPLFGSLADLDRLVADAHAAGLRVLLDLVPNHTSDQHPWFVESRSSRASAKRDWYVWRDGPPDEPPNNWKAAFKPLGAGPDDPYPPAWTYDEGSGQWYLHLFLPEQPDLDWANPEVEAAMHGVVRFWLDRGVDGFRIDVAHGIGKDARLLDDPPALAALPHNQPDAGTHPILRRLRTLVDGYPGDRMLVGEVYLLDTAAVAPYYGTASEPELHLSFNFPPLFAPWDAEAWRERILDVVREFDPIGAWPTWVLSSHDVVRHRTRYGGREDRARAAAVLLLGLRGTAFLYAGEELGLEDAVVPPDRVVDPGGRDGCRAPIPWDGSPSHGWAGGPDPWLPWPPEADRRNVASQRSDPASILWLYRRLLAARRASPALAIGSFEWLAAAEGVPGVLGWERAAGADRRLVLVNFADDARSVAPGPDWVVEISSDGTGEGGPYPGTLAPAQALILRPA